MCDSNNFGDDRIDFAAASSNQSPMMMQQQYEDDDAYEGQEDMGYNDDYSVYGHGHAQQQFDASSAFAGSRMAMLNGSSSSSRFMPIGAREQHQQNMLDSSGAGGDDPLEGPTMEEYYDGDDGVFEYAGEAIGPKNFVVPFEISVCPANTSGDFVQWKLSDAYYKPFEIPENKEFSDEAILAGVDVYNVTSNFPADVALQVSMKKEGVPESERDNPESFIGERLFGPMGLGSHKKMTVHAKISPNDKQDFCVLAGADQYTKSFLEDLNAHSIRNNKPIWTESRLRKHGNYINTKRPGNLLVERDHPVVQYIATRSPSQVNFTEAGADHFSVSKKTFNRAVNSIMSEAAVNIKLGDARKNLRIFAMRLVPSKGKMAGSAWKDERGLFDMITGTNERAQEDAKNRILGKTYSIKGNLCLNYIPIVNL